MENFTQEQLAQINDLLRREKLATLVNNFFQENGVDFARFGKLKLEVVPLVDTTGTPAGQEDFAVKGVRLEALTQEDCSMKPCPPGLFPVLVCSESGWCECQCI